MQICPCGNHRVHNVGLFDPELHHRRPIDALGFGHSLRNLGAVGHPDRSDPVCLRQLAEVRVVHGGGVVAFLIEKLLPAAIGAKMGCPNDHVWAIVGDGGFQMTLTELGTAAQENININVAIINNSYLGMVRQWQELFYNKRYSGVLLDGNPDFVRLAEAYGAKGFLIEKKEDVRPIIEKAFSIKGPVIMDFRIDPNENVFPMVPAGQAIHRMIGTMA